MALEKNEYESKEKAIQDINDEDQEENEGDDSEENELMLEGGEEEDDVDELAGDYNYAYCDDDEEYADGIEDHDGRLGMCLPNFH